MHLSEESFAGCATCPKCKKAAMKKKVQTSLSHPLAFKCALAAKERKEAAPFRLVYIRNYDFLVPPTIEERILQLFKYTMKLPSVVKLRGWVGGLLSL
jgi:hypothetical protein